MAERLNISECSETLIGLNAGAAAGSKRGKKTMTLSQSQWEIVGECDECGDPVYYNEDEGKLTSDCPCMHVDPKDLPQWVQDDMGYREDEKNDESMDVPYNDDSTANDSLAPEQGLTVVSEDEIFIDEIHL